jgi:hypothetical protein
MGILPMSITGVPRVKTGPKSALSEAEEMSMPFMGKIPMLRDAFRVTVNTSTVS